MTTSEKIALVQTVFTFLTGVATTILGIIGAIFISRQTQILEAQNQLNEILKRKEIVQLERLEMTTQLRKMFLGDIINADDQDPILQKLLDSGYTWADLRSTLRRIYNDEGDRYPSETFLDQARERFRRKRAMDAMTGNSESQTPK